MPAAFHIRKWQFCNAKLALRFGWFGMSMCSHTLHIHNPVGRGFGAKNYIRDGGKGEGMTKAKKAEQADAIEFLRQILKPGDIVYCVLRHVARSGMTWHIDFYLLGQGEPRWLSGYMSTALGLRRAPHDNGLVVGGCGMDMGFHCVYNLSRGLWPDGVGCIGEGCPSNDHSNGDRDRTIGHPHRNGGYALRSRWL
jgi:hypothetical protein